MKFTRMICLTLAAILAIMGLSAAMADAIWQRGDTGSEVTRIQARLQELGYLDTDPTGTFDEATEAAVLAFQGRNSLLKTGMADSKTLEVLFSDSARPAQKQEERKTWDSWGLTEEEPAEGYAEAEVWDAAVSFAYAPMPTATSMPNGMAAESWGYPGPYAWNTNEYTYIRENGFQSVAAAPLSTFAADVDTASYAQLRSLILAGREVPADAVRIEEMLNYFRYDYAQPEGDSPFGVTMHLAQCPWNADTLLLQVGLQAKTVMPEDRPPHNLVFLIDVSGSMWGSDRLDLVKRAFQLLVDELQPTDTVSIVTYASRDEVVLQGVPAADKVRILEAIEGLDAGGSTNSAAGIQTAYAIAERYAVPGGVNRVLMATDGDFNVGTTSEGDLARLVTEKKQNGVRLTMLGVGYGNYKDNKLEALADYGDGNYYYLDSIFEARRALVTEAGGTFVEVARDVKFQLDFNPAKVKAYRLIGYEDRTMAAQDFADDTKDGGELGSGHRVTALYEIVPVGSAMELNIPESRYQQPASGEAGDEWLTLNIRAKKPGRDASDLEVYPLTGEPLAEMPEDMRFAASVAETGMLLRNSEYSGTATWQSALELVRSCPGVTGDALKEEFVYLLTLLERSH